MSTIETPPPQQSRARTETDRARTRGFFLGIAATVAGFALIGAGAGLGFATGQVAVRAGLALGAGSAASTRTVPENLSPGHGSGRSQSPFFGGQDPFSEGDGSPFSGGSSSGGSAPSAGTGTSTLGQATAAQQTGVVDVTTVMKYSGAEAAGTGIILSADGEILTNNHVVEGSTSITVTDVATGEQYPATVVGTDATDDIAVLDIDASGLTPANLGDSGTVSVGDSVTGVGNAGGRGGTPSAAPGTVMALGQTITTQAEGAAASETLDGLIETSADIQAGDSGGPLYNAQDAVVGIDTAASVGTGETAGYAIPISTALSIAEQITSGQDTADITLGYPAFLGVEVGQSDSYRYTMPTAQGATVSGVVDGGPAAQAGLVAGDTITAVSGMTVASFADLQSVLAQYSPGDAVTVTWLDASGSAHSASVTLAQGPAA